MSSGKGTTLSLVLLALSVMACSRTSSRGATGGRGGSAEAAGGSGGKASAGSGGELGSGGAGVATTGGRAGDGGFSSSAGGGTVGSGGAVGSGGTVGSAGASGSGGSVGTGGAGEVGATGGRDGGTVGGSGGDGGRDGNTGGSGSGGSAGSTGAGGAGGTVAAGGSAGDGFVSIFNGKDLAGWSVKATAADSSRVNDIKVDNGSIYFNVGDGGQYIWLYHEGEYKDFHFKCKFQVYKDSRHNSGIQFRSHYDPDLVYSNDKGYLNGPQCDLDASEPARAQSIYDETITVRDWIVGGYGLPAPAGWRYYWSDDPIAWNDHEIIATGTRVRVILNGLTIIDHDFKGVLDNADHSKYSVGMSGHFALQRHSGETLKMRFKDLYVKDLAGVTNYMP
jgi:hypothetical protein